MALSGHTWHRLQFFACVGSPWQSKNLNDNLWMRFPYFLFFFQFNPFRWGELRNWALDRHRVRINAAQVWWDCTSGFYQGHLPIYTLNLKSLPLSWCSVHFSCEAVRFMLALPGGSMCALTACVHLLWTPKNRGEIIRSNKPNAACRNSSVGIWQTTQASLFSNESQQGACFRAQKR